MGIEDYYPVMKDTEKFVGALVKKAETTDPYPFVVPYGNMARMAAIGSLIGGGGSLFYSLRDRDKKFNLPRRVLMSALLGGGALGALPLATTALAYSPYEMHRHPDPAQSDKDRMEVAQDRWATVSGRQTEANRQFMRWLNSLGRRG